MDNEKIFSIRKKIYDSILIFNDITNRNISFTRDYLNYILVYNEDKNPQATDKKEVQESCSRIMIAKYLIEGKSKKRFIRFGLERFVKLYFKNVFTYTKKEFEEEFIANL